MVRRKGEKRENILKKRNKRMFNNREREKVYTYFKIL